NATALRNTAVAEVRTEWSLFLDDDVVPADDYLDVVEGHLLTETAPVVQGCPFHCANPGSTLARLESELYRIRIGMNRLADGSVTFCDARNLLIRSRLIQRFPFDQSLVTGEGYALARRLLGAGITILYDKSLVVYHFNRETL